MRRVRKIILDFWSLLVIFLLVFVFFWRFFLKGLLPIPADIVAGMYYPWLDYKWGYVVGVPVKNPLLSDVVSVIYLLRRIAVEIFGENQFPLWNKYSFSGYPLLGNPQAAVLYPLNFIYFFFPQIEGWSIQVVLQSLLAGIFMYLFLSSIIKKKIACLLGAIIFAFSGFMIIFLEYNVQAQAVCILPLLFWSIEKLTSEKKIKWGIVFSCSLAVQILAGYPQVVIYSLLALGLYFFFKKNPRLIPHFFFFLFLGIALAAVHLFPAGEFLSFSQRIHEAPQGELSFLPWQEFINFLVPDFFGNPSTANFWGKGNYTNLVGFTGIISFILAMISIIQIKRSREVKFFFFLFILSLILAFPTPLALLIGRANWLGLGAASATRVLFLTNFSIAILAAVGFQFLWEKKENPFDYLYKIPFLLTVILMGIFIGVFLTRRMMLPYEKIYAPQEEALKLIKYWTVNLGISLRNLVLPIIFSLSTTLVIFIIERVRVLKKAGLLLLSFLLIGELFRFGWKYLPFSQKNLLFPKTPVIEFLTSQEKPFRILGGDVIPMNMWAAYGLESPAGYDALYPLRYAKFLNVVNGGKLENDVSRYGDIKKFDSPLIDLVNVKYVLSLKYNEEGRVDPAGEVSYKVRLPKFKPVFEDKSVVVLENTQVFPRAFLVYDYQVETNEQKIVEILLNPEFNLRKKIVLEEKVSEDLKEGKIKRVDYFEEVGGESKILVDHEGSGFLFVSDSFYPGWKAYIDGKEAKIYRANYIFRAVFIPEGRHEVRFIYDPESFKIGWGFSLVSATLLLALGGWSLVRQG